MEAFLAEIEATIGAGIYSTALMSAMMVPDACGAIEFANDAQGRRRKNGERYQMWFDQYVVGYHSRFFTFDGEVVWKLRNGMIHETALALQSYGFDRVLFTVPDNSGSVFHMNINSSPAGSALNLNLPTFCNDIIAGARNWLTAIARDQAKQGQLDKLVQLRPAGLAPHIVGVPLVA